MGVSVYNNFAPSLLRAGPLMTDFQTTSARLQELILSYNEIRTDGGEAIGKACSSLPALSKLDLDGNQFGDDGKKKVQFHCHFVVN